jgi:hypothetical protein
MKIAMMTFIYSMTLIAIIWTVVELWKKGKEKRKKFLKSP